MKKLLVFLYLISIAFSYNVKLSDKIIKTLELTHGKKSVFTEANKQKIDLTLILFDAKRNWDDLTPEAKEYVQKYIDRPTLPPNNYISKSNKFQIYYYTTGTDAVSLTDANSNSVPDFVELVANTLDSVYTVYQNTGFVMPYPVYPTKSTPTKFAVFLSGSEAGDGVYGYVEPEIKLGDNPSSSQIEKSAWSSYMVLRNEYVNFVGGNTTIADIALKATCAHEFMHAVQFSVAETMDQYFMEMAATWAEQFIFPNFYDNIQYSMMFTNPDISLDYDDDETSINDYSGHWYSTWYFLKYITTRYGNNILVSLYNNHISMNTYQSFNKELAKQGTDFKNTYFNTAITLGIMNNNSSLSNIYYLQNAANYLTELAKYGISNVKYEKSYTFDGTNSITFNFANSNKILWRFGTDYFNIKSNSNFTIALNSDNPDSLKVALIQSDKKNLPTKMKVTIAAKNNNSYLINVNDASNYAENILVVSNISKITDTISVPYNFTISKLTANENTNLKNYSYNLFQNYPNPFNPTTTISYSLPDNMNISLKVYNILGSETTTLYEGYQRAGIHKIQFNANNLNSGIYLVKLTSNYGAKFIKVNLVK
ncbi:MAG TPA: T9SS type A sorting domain-containing protein [Ignavibacteriales bacterium]|nr:T9SS type A sorting domain-containing protein [Ignavibacteriales bacterium]